MKTPDKDRRFRDRLRPVAVVAATAWVIGLMLAACELTPKSTVVPAPKMAPAASVSSPVTVPAENPGLAEFRQTIRPLLKEHCYECHGDGKSEAGIAFDKLTADDQLLKNPELWLKVIKNTRAGIMPADGPRLSAKDQAALDHWIKFAAFGVDPLNLDPGRVTAHRLNRLEYRNTIRDLLGVDFDTDAAFPGDDIGYGFDNIADVLNVPPLLMEKYLAAAQTVVGQAVPATSRVAPAIMVLGRDFVDAITGRQPALDNSTIDHGVVTRTAVKTSYFKAASFTHAFPIAAEGDYQVVVERGVSSNFTYVPQTCNVAVVVDGKEMNTAVLLWHGANSQTEKQLSTYDRVSVHWTPGDHQVTVAVTPLSVVSDGSHDASFLLRSVTIEGPTDDRTKWGHPPGYARFFTRDDAPADSPARRAYARELLGAFASKAFRRPVPAESLDKLVEIAEAAYGQPGKTFELGVAQAMVAVLASPRFLFRIDAPAAAAGQPAAFAKVDEYSLASRLSYFLWSTMPDEQLMQLAAAGRLRDNLATQVQRMVADPRSTALINSFSGQWLQSRAVLTVPINTHEIMLREDFDAPASFDLTPEQRTALHEEAQAYFGHVMRNDRSVDEFLDSNYMFLNQTLANYYELAPDLRGNEMRKVDLPAGDWRGGILTLGSVLMVTSNPTRTSPVKRGKWILDNILDAPAPPPPANIPPLEAAGQGVAGRTPSQREILALHRADPNCASCHNRMDPLGLALENFNALGTVRQTDMKQPIDATGKLSSGETFKDIRDVKHVLLANHRDEFYRCLTQKLLTYALGRGMEYYDVATVDQIVDNLVRHEGRFSALLLGIIDSPAFQEERLVPEVRPPAPAKFAALVSPNHPTSP